MLGERPRGARPDRGDRRAGLVRCSAAPPPASTSAWPRASDSTAAPVLPSSLPASFPTLRMPNARASSPAAASASKRRCAPLGLVTQISAYSPIRSTARRTSSLSIRGSIRIAGSSTTSAPRSRRVAARPLAWARARVTTTRRPCRGRRSSQASASRRSTTSPTTISAGAPIPSRSTAAASVPSVATTVRCPSIVPRSTAAAGSSGSRPAAISAAALSPRRLTPM